VVGLKTSKNPDFNVFLTPQVVHRKYIFNSGHPGLELIACANGPPKLPKPQSPEATTTPIGKAAADLT
jgi:hypothetical protein